MYLRLAVVLTFIFVTVLLWFPSWQTSENVEEETALIPAFTAKLLHQELYDESGQLAQEVFSQKMEHFSELSLTHFKQPEFIIYKNHKPFWRLKAQSGIMQDGLLTLDEQVVMLQLTNNDMVESISTDYIEIDLNSNIVTTDSPITIEGSQLYIKGNGLIANLNVATITLTEHVQTTLIGNDNG